MKNNDFLEQTVHLTFPTSRKTAYTLTKLAKQFGKTQPELLNDICQEYISETMLLIIEKLSEKNVDVAELLKTEIE